MVFQVPASKASVKQNRFEFALDGTTYSVPKLKFLKPHLVAGLEGQTKLGAMLQLLEEYHPGVSSKIEDAEQMTALYEAWAAASGVDLGESSASSDS